MTDAALTPADLAGTVRGVQHQLRERYGATTATLRAEDDGTETVLVEDGQEAVSRDEPIRISLEWRGTDLGGPQPEDNDPLLERIRQGTQKVDEVLRDYPEADVSTFIDREHIRLNVDLEAPA